MGTYRNRLTDLSSRYDSLLVVNCWRWVDLCCSEYMPLNWRNDQCCALCGGAVLANVLRQIWKLFIDGCFSFSCITAVRCRHTHACTRACKHNVCTVQNRKRLWAEGGGSAMLLTLGDIHFSPSKYLPSFVRTFCSGLGDHCPLRGQLSGQSIIAALLARCNHAACDAAFTHCDHCGIVTRS